MFFIVILLADIEGELKTQTAAWKKTANGRERIQDLQGDYRGLVEIIEWHDLLVDAKSRNEVFISQLQI